jgi:cellulose synthase/poly-beta-1,6-N-acetylglucosamine synthase-like glycosyltransferase
MSIFIYIRYLYKKREIKIISRPNKGVINTIIELISYVDTDYFTILESDDYLDKQAIEKFLLATQDGTVDIVGSK